MSDKPLVVVTGCAGFLGSHFLKMLMVKEVDIIGVDNASPAQFSTKNVSINKVDLLGSDGINSLRRLLDRTSNKDIYLVHLLGMPDANACQKDRMLAKDLNYKSVELMWELAEERAVKKIVFPSTALVYGMRHKDPIQESFPILPENIYAAIKLEAENYLVRKSVGSRVATVILRLSNIYGKSMSSNTVVNTIIKQLESGYLDLKEYRSVRDYIYVEDVINALISSVFSECAHKIYNIGSSIGYSVVDLAMAIAKVMNRSDIVSKMRLREDDISGGSRLVLCCDRIRKDLGWKPIFNLESGIKRMING